MSLIFSNGKLDKLITTTRTIVLDDNKKHNWNLSGSTVILCDLTTSTIPSSPTPGSYLTVTGIEAGFDGEIKIIIHIAPSNTTKWINFYHNHTSSSINNRIFLPEGSNYRLSSGAGLILMYLTATNRWHMIGETNVGGLGFSSTSIGAAAI